MSIRPAMRRHEPLSWRACHRVRPYAAPSPTSGKKLTAHLGKRSSTWRFTRAPSEHAGGYITGGTLFEEMGFFT